MIRERKLIDLFDDAEIQEMLEIIKERNWKKLGEFLDDRETTLEQAGTFPGEVCDYLKKTFGGD